MARERPPSSRFPQQHQEMLFKSAAPGDFTSVGGYYGNPVGGGLGMIASSSSPSLLLLDSTGLKHDTGLAVEWSADEQYKLEGGLSMLVFLYLFVVFRNELFFFWVTRFHGEM